MRWLLLMIDDVIGFHSLFEVLEKLSCLEQKNFPYVLQLTHKKTLHTEDFLVQGPTWSCHHCSKTFFVLIFRTLESYETL